MIHFPTTIINDFFEDPYGVIDISKGDNVEWNPAPDGSWPGVRSQEIYNIDQDFYTHMMKKYLYTFFNQADMEMMAYEATSYYQRIPCNLGAGWIHSDFPDLHTFIIYLTPDANINSGTGIYTPKNIHAKVGNLQMKKDCYLGKITINEAEPARLEHNAQYNSDTMVYNRFNRLVGFDSHQWHGVESYETGVDDKERLTIVTFIRKLSCPPTAYQRMKAVPMFREFKGN